VYKMNQWDGANAGGGTEDTAPASISFNGNTAALGFVVTCRWHARLDVSGVLSVANSAKVTILCTDPEPLLA
jgi:hypothetical protein